MEYLHDINGWMSAQWGDFVNGMARGPLNFARANGFPNTVGVNNAIAHAYMAGFWNIINNEPFSDVMQWSKEIPTYHADVFTLPELHGYGIVPDLWVAMTDDASLRTDVTNLVNADYSSFNFGTFRDSVENILMKWADAETVNPTSRGTEVDARHLVALEHLTGTPFNAFGNANPNHNTGIALEVTWDQMVAQVAARFLSFIPLKVLIDANRDIFTALEDITDPKAMTQQEVNDLFDPILNPANAAFDNHPLKWAVELQYNYATDGFDGDLKALTTTLTALAPSTEAAKQDFWFDKVSMFRAAADSQGMTNTQFETALAGSYLGNTGVTGAQWRSDGLLLGNSAANTLVGSTSDGFSPLGNDVLYGGLGNDTLQGGTKDDTYILRAGDGVDVINDYLGYVSPSADKVLPFISRNKTISVDINQFKVA